MTIIGHIWATLKHIFAFAIALSHSHFFIFKPNFKFTHGFYYFPIYVIILQHIIFFYIYMNILMNGTALRQKNSVKDFPLRFHTAVPEIGYFQLDTYFDRSFQVKIDITIALVSTHIL